jgi:hypothetical protein
MDIDDLSANNGGLACSTFRPMSGSIFCLAFQPNPPSIICGPLPITARPTASAAHNSHCPIVIGGLANQSVDMAWWGQCPSTLCDRMRYSAVDCTVQSSLTCETELTRQQPAVSGLQRISFLCVVGHATNHGSYNSLLHHLARFLHRCR